MMTPAQKEQIIAAAFKSHTLATRYEDVIAAAMHKREGLNGKLPKATIHTQESQKSYRERYTLLLENAPRKWTRTRDVAAQWGMTMETASNALRRFREKGLIDSRSVSGHRQWRAKT